MTPAEHYAEAEHLLALAEAGRRHDTEHREDCRLMLAEAQVHATLATVTGPMPR